MNESIDIATSDIDTKFQSIEVWALIGRLHTHSCCASTVLCLGDRRELRSQVLTAASTASETSVYFNETTRRYIPEGCHVQILLG
jgi:hypothetical protein